MIFIILFILMFIGVPIAFAIAGSGVIFLQLTNLKPLIVSAQRVIVGMDSFPLLAIPLFTLGGYLMESLGISKRLIDWVKMFCTGVTGAMGMVTIVSCTIFAALTGSGPATVAAIGSLMIPNMVESGYKIETAAGLTAAAGALGPIIPPSIAMIVYASTMGVSATGMFMNAIVPGLVVAFMLCVTNYFIARKHHIKGEKKHYTFKEILTNTCHASGALLLPIIILGGIYGGVFTPTEAATVCVVYSLILGLIYKELTLNKLTTALRKTLRASAAVVFIIACANLFGWLLTVTRVPNKVTEALVPILHSKYIYLIVLSLLLFVVGALMDTLASIVVLAPIIVPIGLALGVNEMHLALVFCINLIVGFVTPPFGVNLFTAVQTAQISYSQVVKGTLPFMITAMVSVLVITFSPWICTLVA